MTAPTVTEVANLMTKMIIRKVRVQVQKDWPGAPPWVKEAAIVVQGGLSNLVPYKARCCFGHSAYSYQQIVDKIVT